MKAGPQLLVAARLLNTTPGFSALLNLFAPSHQLSLYCRETSVLCLELDGHLPAEVAGVLGQGDQDKIAAFRQTLSRPGDRETLMNSIGKLLPQFFSTDITKCELKARQYEEGPAVLTLLGLLHDYAGQMLERMSFEDLIPNLDVTFQLASGYMQKSTELRMNATDGYLLSRLEQPLALSEIFAVVPVEEEQTKRTVLMLWANGILNSPALEQLIPKISTQQSPKLDTRPGTEPLKPPVSVEPVPEPADDFELVNQTYQNLSKKDLYGLLGIPSRVELPEIKAAYYKLAKRFHPDRFYGVKDSDLKAKVDIIFSAINVAYETLKNARTRTQYDNSPVEQKKAVASTLVRTGPETPVDRDEAMQKVAEDYYKRAQAAFDAGNYYQAVQFLRSATQISPTDARYWRQLGISLSKNPQWKKEAEDSFTRAMELEPKNPDNHLYLGFLYKNLGLKLRARKQFAGCLEMDPKNELAHRELGLLEAEEKEQQQKKGLLGGFFKKK